MGQQYLTIDGTYVEGRIMPVSDILPRGSFHVLITFLAPLPDSRKGEDKSRGLMEFFQEEQSHILIHQLGITDRELEVLHLVQKGYTNTQIANELDLGSGTVRNYISALLAKVKAANRTQLVTIAKEKGILTD